MPSVISRKSLFHEAKFLRQNSRGYVFHLDVLEKAVLITEGIFELKELGNFAKFPLLRIVINIGVTVKL